MAYSYITESGVIIPDTEETRAAVVAEYKAAFGQDLPVDPETPQGMLITAEVLARNNVLRNNATLANQINPNQAGGIFLDAIMALTGTYRRPQEYSEINGAVLTGVPSDETTTTIIPAGSIAQSNGNNFSLVSDVTLDSGGVGTGNFVSVLPGPIAAPEGTLTTIVSNDVLGWETVTNPNAAIIGQETQTDEQARIIRRNTLAAQGFGLAEAVKSALYLTPGVKSLEYAENRTGEPIVVDAVTLVPHSLWACVDGGTDQAIAATLTAKKGGGCDYNGLVTVPVVDPYSGQSISVQFDRPIEVPVLAQIVIATQTTVADAINIVIEAILAYANGLLNNEPGFVVGAPVSPFELSGAITCEAPQIFVKDVQVSYADPISWTRETLIIHNNEKATIVAGSIQVTVA